MNYDFETTVNRLEQGSAKWQEFNKQLPEATEDISPLSVADVDLAHPPELITGLQKYLETMILGYTRPTKSYYAAVMSWFARRHNWHVREEWIIPSPGVVSALYHSVKAFTDVGDGVLILSPVYYPFRKAIMDTGRHVVASSLLNENDHYVIDFEDLETKASAPNTKLLIFCSPHNPVGRVWTVEELQKVAEICQRHHVLVVSDEIHFDMIRPGYHHHVYSTLSLQTQENSVILTAPSKTFNLAGLQTSNVVIENPELRERYLQVQGKDGFHMLNAIGPKACELVYEYGEPWLLEFSKLIETNRQIFEQFIAEYLPMIRVIPLEGSYLQWFNCEGLGLDDDALDNFLVHDCQLVLDPGSLFGEEGQGYQRINLACSTVTLTAALERLHKQVKELKND